MYAHTLYAIFANPYSSHNQHTRELISTQVQQQRPESPTVTLTNKFVFTISFFKCKSLLLGKNHFCQNIRILFCCVLLIETHASCFGLWWFFELCLHSPLLHPVTRFTSYFFTQSCLHHPTVSVHSILVITLCWCSHIFLS